MSLDGYATKHTILKWKTNLHKEEHEVSQCFIYFLVLFVVFDLNLSHHPCTVSSLDSQCQTGRASSRNDHLPLPVVQISVSRTQ